MPAGSKPQYRVIERKPQGLSIERFLGEKWD